MIALLLLAFGGPRSLDDVEFLLARLFRRKPSPEILERVKERYRLIGGFSPLPEITSQQARALEKRLNERGLSVKSFVGMRYSHPLIEETVDEILREGIREVITLPMSPLRSKGSTGAYIEEMNRVVADRKEDLKVSFVEGWSQNPLFLDAVRENVREGLSGFAPGERGRVHLLFTAHSLPKSMIENGPYVQDMSGSVKGVLEGLEDLPWHIAFQSRGMGPEEWIGPDVESVLTELATEGVRDVLVVPIGFVADHIEILYDIDILFQEKARSLGMVLKRTKSLNTSEKFILALAAAVEGQLLKELRITNC
jgi:protoporphyrin/coproporphyrin ferrochelatase